MGLFNKFDRSKGIRICSNCGKTMKKVYGVFPTEYLPDTVGAICGSCESLLCHNCRWTQGINQCPKCGGGLLITVIDEDLDRLEKTGRLL